MSRPLADPNEELLWLATAEVHDGDWELRMVEWGRDHLHHFLAARRPCPCYPDPADHEAPCPQAAP